MIENKSSPEANGMVEVNDRTRLAVLNLQMYTRQLRVLGLLIACLTGILILGEFLALANRYISPQLLLTILVVSIASLSCLFLRDSIRKRGDSLFEEISDELQWYVLADSQKNPTNSVRPSIEIRISLR